ncbi:MAG: VTT domain-containing protein [Stagnimonas sp.]|nr:VTT domain-containing protein [Stagnimonas sp.]
MNITDLLLHWGPILIFAAVLVEQLGLPLPAVPLLIGAGALAATGAIRPEWVLLLATLACLLADHGWYLLGRRYGRRLLAGLCRISLSPESCVSRTDRLIGRHGALVLAFAKFIPGVSAVCIPTAAANGLSYPRFLLFDGLGSLLWSGVYLGIGLIFATEINRVLDALDQIGGWALLLIALAFAAYLAWKFWHRWRLRRLYRSARIDAGQLLGLIEQEPELLLLDARSPLARADDPRPLPRATAVDEALLAELLGQGRRDRVLVTFCTCPNEASAALLAKRLIDAGHGRVHVLAGGQEALGQLNRAPSSSAALS